MYKGISSLNHVVSLRVIDCVYPRPIALFGLRYKEITERPEKEHKKPIIFIFKKRKIYISPLDHPWRRFKPVIQNNGYQQKELQT